MSLIGNPINSVAFLTDQFSGNSATTAFTMSVAPATTSSLLVAVSGVVQDPSTYSVNGTTLTFSAAPPTGTGNISVRYLGIPASGVTTTAYRTVTDQTAVAAQTTFSVPSYTVGFINVYQNGVRLGAADYTATNGTTVVLAVGAAAGDLITTESFYVSSVLNAIANTAGAVTQLNLAPNVAGNGPAFSAYNSTNQTGITNFAFVKLLFDTEDYDTNNNFASSRFTASVAGYYQFSAAAQSSNAATTNGDAYISLFKNGSRYKENMARCATGGACIQGSVSSLIYLAVGDYVEVYVYQGAIASANTDSGNYRTFFTGALVRAA